MHKVWGCVRDNHTNMEVKKWGVTFHNSALLEVDKSPFYPPIEEHRRSQVKWHQARLPLDFGFRTFGKLFKDP